MAQRPATPKWTRWVLRGLARISPQLAGPLASAASERAALTLRQARLTPPEATGVTFLIPLVGPAHVADWSAVEARLRSTVDSLLAQTNPNWRAVICCQHRPTLPDDPRLIHLPFTTDFTGNDKWAKLHSLVQHLADLPALPGYVMSFDADDLLHREAVARMLSTRSAGGYLVQAGYVLDHATGGVARADRPTPGQPLRKPFWKLCGSCMALRLDPAQPQARAFLAEMVQHEHRMFPHLARLAGLRPQPLLPPAVLYVLNHGENFGARRGRVGFKTRFVTRFALTDQAELDQISQNFPSP